MRSLHWHNVHECLSVSLDQSGQFSKCVGHADRILTSGAFLNHDLQPFADLTSAIAVSRSRAMCRDHLQEPLELEFCHAVHNTFLFVCFPFRPSRSRRHRLVDGNLLFSVCPFVVVSLVNGAEPARGLLPACGVVCSGFSRVCFRVATVCSCGSCCGGGLVVVPTRIWLLIQPTFSAGTSAQTRARISAYVFPETRAARRRDARRES